MRNCNESAHKIRELAEVALDIFGGVGRAAWLLRHDTEVCLVLWRKSNSAPSYSTTLSTLLPSSGAESAAMAEPRQWFAGKRDFENYGLALFIRRLRKLRIGRPVSMSVIGILQQLSAGRCVTLEQFWVFVKSIGKLE